MKKSRSKSEFDSRLAATSRKLKKLGEEAGIREQRLLASMKVVKERVDKLKNLSAPDRAYWQEFFFELLKNKVLPITFFKEFPESVTEIGKSLFDQVYDSCVKSMVPDYSEDVVESIIGLGNYVSDPSIKIFRAMYPENFGLNGVLIRARSFQEAFAFACDYGCRFHLREFRKFPTDLNIRVSYVNEKFMRRLMDVRHMNRNKKRRNFNLSSKATWTEKQRCGVRNAASCHPASEYYSIVRYAEDKSNVELKKSGLVKSSCIEQESFSKEAPRFVQTFARIDEVDFLKSLGFMKE